MKIMKSSVVALVFALAFAPQVSRADEFAQKALAVLETNKKAIVTIQLVIKEKFSFTGGGDEGSESKSEVPGTVIGADGLTVVSLMSTDPGSFFSEMMDGLDAPIDSDFDMDFNMSSEIVSVKILPEGGKEIPAAIVLRDKDLDLAFIRPLEKPTQPMAALNLADSAKPALLDQLITISRLGKVGGRVPMVSEDRVSAIVEKPRTFYVSYGSGSGTPVFTLDGKIVGIEVMRMINTGDSGSGFSGMMGGDGMLPVIVPAADIAEVAAQAPEKAEEIKPDDEKKEAKDAAEKTAYVPKSKRTEDPAAQPGEESAEPANENETTSPEAKP